MEPTPKNADLVHQQHDDVRHAMGAVQSLLADRRSPVRLCDAIVALADQLGEHFTCEEDGGFFDDIVARAPRFSDRVENLRSQHRAFLNSLGRMTLNLGEGEQGADEWWERIASEFAGFKLQLQKHEEEEIDLLQGAFDDDVGAAD